MNELSKLFLCASSGDCIVLEKDKIYHVYQDDTIELVGYYCSNTASIFENPNGLHRTAIYLKEKQNITIDGNGATVLIHGKMTPFIFDKCENITVRNLVVDYACPTMTEFTILSNDSKGCLIQINPDCRFRIEGNDLIWQGELDSERKPYWEDNWCSRYRWTRLYNPATETSKQVYLDMLPFGMLEHIDGSTVLIHTEKKIEELPAGCIVQTRNIIRDETGGLFQRCKNILFENLQIKFMHGLGLVAQFCENVTYRKCDLTPAEGRTITSTADFFQFSGCRGRILIEDCVAWGAHDDIVNVHGTHLQIVEKDEIENSIIVRFKHKESWGFQAFEVGDELEFIKWDTLIAYNRAYVLEYSRLNDTDIKIYLDRSLPEIMIGKDVVENATWTPELCVRGCDFGPARGRGVLCTTRGNVVIENNRFYKLDGAVLNVEDDCNFWFESGYTKEVVFQNNRIIGCDCGATWEGAPIIRYTPKVMDKHSTSYVHGKLVINGNVFEKSYFEEHSIWLDYVKEVEITENTFDAPYRVKICNVENVLNKNNQISKLVTNGEDKQ